jgi:hypothetical protein
MTQVVWHQHYKASAQWSVQPALIQAEISLMDGSSLLRLNGELYI